ncbi:N-terminal Xaa-Pro-Lys N-methyltransferase 1-like [Schistocerca gregaria]|uniref:N-terminal Xaa-Pro-Lys N-methyltransferase 1-like n=1 Tax=Schistocerca gregaria TaxID=7010 RepID=UPI00211EFE3C|nr:N-terminal Xaa-Pro-Lys N-methyltransferase 1-like [Schistocerca gregaria]
MPPSKTRRGRRSGKDRAQENASETTCVWLDGHCRGTDNRGKSFSTLDSWWKRYTKNAPAKCANAKPSSSTSKEKKPSDDWYSVCERYWERVEATNNGMLGGFPDISSIDLASSYKFLTSLLKVNDATVGTESNRHNKRAIDVGAGIGRITSGLLAKIFDQTDLVEQSQSFVDRARLELKQLINAGKIGSIYCSNLRDFSFEHSYDLIWIQWVLMYLLDIDLISFLKRAKQALESGGMIVIKENHTHSGFYADTEDGSVIRSDDHFKLLFKAAGLNLVAEETQLNNFLDQLFPIKAYALN